MHPFEVFDDGDKGVTHFYFNKVGNLLWRNPGGDWIDANGDEQGGAPVASVSLPVSATPYWLTLDATAFAQNWQTDGNNGLVLRGVGNKALYWTREHTDPLLRPYMNVTTEAGSVMCPCVADTYTDPSSAYGLGERDRMTIGTAMLRFDMSGVTGTILAATIHLHTFKQYGAHQLQAFWINPPVPYDQQGRVVEQGFAAGYVKDVDLESDPRVLAMWDWPADWRTTSGVNPHVIRTHELVEQYQNYQDPVTGRWWMRMLMPLDSTCTHQGEGTVISLHYELGPVPASIDPIPQVATHPNEVYARYSIKLDEDWTSNGDPQFTGGKFPGLEGRYGFPVQGKYWESICGNSGSPGHGKYVPAGFADPKPGFCGWNARGRWNGEAYGQDSNPMKDVTPIGFENYRPGIIEANNGEIELFPDFFMEPGRVYHLEQHVKCNTIVGPYDQYGNGTGLNDGVLEWWVDGIKLIDRHDVTWTNHPFIAIQGFWYAIKNGGTLSGCLPHHVHAGPVVLATEYIGPPNMTEEPPPPPPPPDDCEPPYPAPEGCVWEHSWVLNCDEPPPPPPPPPPATALAAAAQAVAAGQCVEFPAPSLLVPDSSGSRPFDAPPGSGGVTILDWASCMDYDPVLKRFYFSGGRPLTEWPPQKMIWYDEIEDKWDSRENWSMSSGGHIYRATTVIPGGTVIVERNVMHEWDGEADTYVRSFPACPRQIGGLTNGWQGAKCIVWHPGLGSAGSVVMMNQSGGRVVRWDASSETWDALATLGSALWSNQHLTAHYNPAAGKVIGGYSQAGAPQQLAIVAADGTVTLSAPAPCDITTGGATGNPFVPHPTRAASIAFCRTTGRVWSYDFELDEWLDMGAIPAELNVPPLIGGTCNGVVFVARRDNRTFIYKPDF